MMILSGSAEKSEFSRTSGVGDESRIALKITPVLSPRNRSMPVAISYSTAPNENQSDRASNSFARTFRETCRQPRPSLLRGRSDAPLMTASVVLPLRQRSGRV